MKKRHGRAKAFGQALLLSLTLVCSVNTGVKAQDLAPIGMVSSERLRLMAYGEALAKGAPRQLAAPLRSEMVAQGYYHDGKGLQITRKSVQFAPLLGWDGNINGGVWRDRFALNNMIFISDPDFRAKAGIVMGGTLAGQLRSAWAEGRLVELQAVSELGYSPRHHLWRGDLALSACSRNQLKGWSFLDLCAAGFRSWRALSTDDSYRVSGRISHLVARAQSLHDIGVTVEQASSTARPQARVSIGVESLWPHAVSELRLTLGRPVEDATVLRERLDFSLGAPIWGRAWSLDLWLQRAEGSRFLGLPRHDEAWGIGMASSLRDGLTLRIGYSDSRSTAPIAQYSQVSLDLKFNALSW